MDSNKPADDRELDLSAGLFSCRMFWEDWRYLDLPDVFNINFKTTGYQQVSFS